MGHVMTAEDLLDELRSTPFLERGRFFSLLGRNFLQDDNLRHEQVFGHLANAEFSSQEAAEYLEISIATFRRYVQRGKLKPSRVVGRSQIFSTQSLKKLKHS